MEGKMASVESRSKLIPQSDEDIDIDIDGLHESNNNDDSLNKIDEAKELYINEQYEQAMQVCEEVYQTDTYKVENLLLLGAIHFQLRNYSESIFYNQQAIRIEPTFAEAYSNLGNALRELGDIDGAIKFYLKSIKQKPRFCDVYNNLASAYLQLGKTKQALETYQMAIVLNPNLVDAHSNIGNLLKAQGKLDEAKKCYLEAIRIQPDYAIAWSNLAGIFKDEDDIETAIAYYQESIRLAPTFADAYSNLGNAFRQMNRLDEAKDSYKKAIHLKSDFAIAHSNLASVLYDEGNLEQSIATFKHAIQLEPNFPDAYNNLGNAFRETNQIDDAIKCYKRCLQLKPDHPLAYNNLGNALKDKHLVKEAVHCYMTACRLMPSFAAAHCNLASIFKEQGRLDHALAHYHEAIAIDARYADAYSNLGNAYKDLGRLDEAVKCYTQAIKLKPGFADAYCNLANAYREGNRMGDAITCYRKALSLRPDFNAAAANLHYSLMSICDWRSRDEDLDELLALTQRELNDPHCELPSVQPFHALIYGNFDLRLQRRIAQCYAQASVQNTRLFNLRQFRFRGKRSSEKLRVGYVTSNVNNHPVAFLLSGLLEHHSPDKLDVFVYSLSGSDGSSIRNRLEALPHVIFRDLGAAATDEVVKAIHSDNIHVLVNTNGYTKHAKNNIFALRPAPMQVHFPLSYCGTLGADYVDYAVVDETVVGKDEQQHFSEALLHLPNSYLVNNHSALYKELLTDTASLTTRKELGLDDAKFVLANFNQNYKIDPEVFDAWCKVLKAVPDSVLLLLRFPTLAEPNLRAEARGRGIKDDQIVFLDVVSKEKHMQRIHVVDLFLDTSSCNSCTTALDVLYAGVPMVTKHGSKPSSRVASSLLKAVGMHELITYNLTDYVDKAVFLAKHANKLRSLREALQQSRDTNALFDTKKAVASIEDGFEMIWERYEKGLKPQHVHVKQSLKKI